MFAWRDSNFSVNGSPMIWVCVCVCVKTQNDPDVLVVISSLIRTSGTCGEASGWTQNFSQNQTQGLFTYTAHITRDLVC